MADRCRPSAASKRTIAKLLRDGATSVDLDTRAPKAPKAPEPTPEERRAMGKWFVERLRQSRGSGTVAVPVTKRRIKDDDR